MVDYDMVFSVPHALDRPFSSIALAARSFDAQSVFTMQTAFDDDLAVVAPILDWPKEHASLISALSLMPSAVVNILTQRGMIVNDKPGKSALLLSLVGRCAVTSKRIFAATIPFQRGTRTSRLYLNIDT